MQDMLERARHKPLIHYPICLLNPGPIPHSPISWTCIFSTARASAPQVHTGPNTNTRTNYPFMNFMNVVSHLFWRASVESHMNCLHQPEVIPSFRTTDALSPTDKTGATTFALNLLGMFFVCILDGPSAGFAPVGTRAYQASPPLI